MPVLDWFNVRYRTGLVNVVDTVLDCFYVRYRIGLVQC
jgi:hypothetical protein